MGGGRGGGGRGTPSEHPRVYERSETKVKGDRAGDSLRLQICALLCRIIESSKAGGLVDRPVA
jgi:hypothetical protein